jgi:inhibitor of cysteine peptidase
MHGNPTTGYEWTVKEIGDQNALEINSHYNAPDSNLMGAGGVYVFNITAMQPGKVALVFEYKRSWEKNVAPAETKTYKFIVTN